MKTIILALSLILTISSLCYAQCGEKFKITTSKTLHLDSTGNIVRTDDEKAIVVISPKDVHITVSNDQNNHEMTGTIENNDCSWPVAYKEGKSVIKTVMNDGSGEDKHVTITITGKNGQITLLFEVEGEPDDRIEVAADTFEQMM